MNEIIAQTQAKATGQFVRCRRVQRNYYVIEVQHEGAWFEVPASSATNKQGALWTMRHFARALLPDTKKGIERAAGFAVLRPASS